MTHDGGPFDPMVEVGRLVRLWRDLPLERAEVGAVALRRFAGRLADDLAPVLGAGGSGIRDLGPGTACDQVVVLVLEWLEHHPEPDARERLAAELRDLRHQIPG